jgi:hypothetical protein
MTVDRYAEILLSGGLRLVEEKYYENKVGRTGYKAIYKNSRAYYWYSVSGTEVRVAPDEVAQAVTDPERQILREKTYSNRKTQPGFEATIRAGEHCFMLNSSPDPPQF